MGIKVLNGGLLTTVQDAGRRGYQRFGLGVSGAVDLQSYNYANILVGNKEDEAVLEATLLGPTLEFTSPTVIALTGGNLSPQLNHQPCPMYQALAVSAGDVLSFGSPQSGCRAYIAFAGGLDVPAVMGSRSTYLKAKLGGFEGRKLAPGDEIAFRESRAVPENLAQRVMEAPQFSGSCTLRVLLGPQDERFTQEGVQTFLNSSYTVSNEFDRMGCRLTGPKIAHVTDGNIITDGISFGAIQVPDGGEPIVMLSDRQTTGGYTKIASVISVDIPLIAQCKPGDTVRFVNTNIDKAQEAYLAQQEKYRQLRQALDPAPAPVKADSAPAPGQEAPPPAAPSGHKASGSGRKFKVSIDGEIFQVEVVSLD